MVGEDNKPKKIYCDCLTRKFNNIRYKDIKSGKYIEEVNEYGLNQVVIELNDIEEFTDKLRGLDVGDRARLIIKRGSEEMDVEIQFRETKQ